MRAEVADQTDRWRLWAPVFFGAGCAAYFTLKVEPAGWPLIVAAVLSGGAWLAGRRLGLARRWTLALLMLARRGGDSQTQDRGGQRADCAGLG